MIEKHLLAAELRRRGFRIHKSASALHLAIAAEFPMHYMNLVHAEKNRLILITIAFDDTGRIWMNTGDAFPELASLGFAEFLIQELSGKRPKKLH